MQKTEYGISEFARLTGCTRQNISAIAKRGELLVKNKNGKIDITDKTNHDYMLSQEYKKQDLKEYPQEKKIKVITKHGTNKKPDKIDSKPDNPEEPEENTLRDQARNAKYRSEIYKSEKAALELKKSRAEVAEIDTLGKTCIGYLHALNQNILDQPRSFVDKFESALKTGKSKTVLTDILREPIMDSISDAMEAIDKEIKRYKRDIKSDNING